MDRAPNEAEVARQVQLDDEHAAQAIQQEADKVGRKRKARVGPPKNKIRPVRRDKLLVATHVLEELVGGGFLLAASIARGSLLTACPWADKQTME